MSRRPVGRSGRSSPATIRGRLAGARCLHLHDIGAETGEQLGAVRQGLHLLDGQDAHAVERLPVLQRVGVGDISELHAGHSTERSRTERSDGSGRASGPEGGNSKVVARPRERARPWGRPDRLTEPSGTIRRMRGIISAGGYVPYRRLDRASISEFLGSGGGRGQRTVASYDEDTTTMGVEAGRVALGNAPAGVEPEALWFATVAPAYLDKTNATTIHAALRLDADVALDFNGSARSAVGALKTALTGNGTVLLVTSDLRTGQPGSSDEANGGDGAAALIIGSDGDGPVIAEYLGGASSTEEFIERWRVPGDDSSGLWEERFGEMQYAPLVESAWKRGLDAAGVGPDQVDKLIVSGLHARAVRTVTPRLGATKEALVNDRSATVGNTGAAQAALLLTDALEQASPGEVIALVSLADGADVLVFRTTDAIASWNPERTVAKQDEWGAPLGYGKM